MIFHKSIIKMDMMVKWIGYYKNLIKNPFLPQYHTFKTAKLLFAARAAEEKARAEAAAKEAETK